MGIVPDMFQVPISAPTASRMKMALTMEDRPLRPASAISSQVWPFRRMTKPVTIEQITSATWSGPSRALSPNR